ncbi:MAG: hypothetical protein GXO32_05040 [Crenarchaeota archaeon]|nr:hypothetical protein [Thermoproteota archaeon]
MDRRGLYLAIGIVGAIFGFAASMVSIYLVQICGHIQTATVTKTVTITVREGSEVKVATPFIGADYYDFARFLIESAKRYVYVMVTDIESGSGPWSKPYVLLHELCSLRRKGVDVRVLTSYSAYQMHPQAIEYLQRCGVQVKLWASCGSLWSLSASLVIVDGKAVIIGSQSWTDRDLAHSVGAGIEMYSDRIAAELAKSFDELWSGNCVVIPPHQ